MLCFSHGSRPIYFSGTYLDCPLCAAAAARKAAKAAALILDKAVDRMFEEPAPTAEAPTATAPPLAVR